MTPRSIPSLSQALTVNPVLIDDQQPISMAKALFKKHQIHHLIVTCDGDLCGLISDHDLQHHEKLYGLSPLEELLVKDISNDRIVVADVNDPLHTILDVMVQRQLECIVILQDGELHGIFTTTDACRIFSQLLQEYSS